MAKKFGFFNSINGDRKYLASDIAEAFGIGITTGLKSEEGNLQVVPYQNMQVQINPGGAMIFGHFYLNDEYEVIDIDIADGELNRIDRIVLRYDKYERSIKTLVIKGTPALNPVPPSRLETEEQFDLVLADIYVSKAATSIITSNITDMRESDLCGYIGVKGAVTNLEFEHHLSEFISLLSDFNELISGGTAYSLPLQNGWSGSLHYTKNKLGQVWFRGNIQPGNIASDTVVATLPSGYEPKDYSHPIAVYNANGRKTELIFNINSAGEVKITGSVDTNDNLYINDIFKAAL